MSELEFWAAFHSRSVIEWSSNWVEQRFSAATRALKMRAASAEVPQGLKHIARELVCRPEGLLHPFISADHFG
jgi:hypothetical protein